MKPAEFSVSVKRNVARNFDQSLQRYQSFEDRHHFFAALALKLAQRIGLTAGSSVLDIGCGYGLSARVLNAHFGCRVLGVDLSPGMIDAGRSLGDVAGITLVVGDGEDLVPLVGRRRFDYALYNAAIFLFPDVAKTIAEAFTCLRSGGKIAFSFYPQLLGDENEDLLQAAFQRLGEPPPRFRVITDYDAACDALAQRCEHIRHHRWVRPLDTAFLLDFFSIPAQSASLFPGRPYADRRRAVRRLFDTLGDMEGKGTIVWRMAEGTKV